jgi:hypothetical protein
MVDSDASRNQPSQSLIWYSSSDAVREKDRVVILAVQMAWVMQTVRKVVSSQQYKWLGNAKREEGSVILAVQARKSRPSSANSLGNANSEKGRIVLAVQAMVHLYLFQYMYYCVLLI